MPQPFLLLGRKVVIGLKDVETVLGGLHAEGFFPLSHLLAVPALHTSVEYAQRWIGDNQPFIDTDNAAKTFAHGAGTDRGVERKHIVVGLFKANAVGLKLVGEVVGEVGREEHQSASAVALKKCRFQRIVNTRHGVRRMVNRQAVDHDEHLIGIHFIGMFYHIFNTFEFTLVEYACKALLQFQLQLFAKRIVSCHTQGCQYHELGSFRESVDAGQNVFGGVLFDLLSANRRISVANTGEEHTQIIINLGACSHRRAGIARIHFLFHGNGRR